MRGKERDAKNLMKMEILGINNKLRKIYRKNVEKVINEKNY